MWSSALVTVAAAFFHFSAASVISARGDTVCAGQVTLSESYIGEDKSVKVQHVTCPDVSVAAVQPRALDTRQAVENVCGATCMVIFQRICGTHCFTPSGGGPVPNDCHVIADALRFENQNTGALFLIGTGTNNTVVMQFATCLSFFVNQDVVTEEYCRTDWASLIDFIAPNCQSTQNAHGGNCVATDQRWFAQVQHS
ncbi:hypothetical protein B0H10DRAFT_2184378 [Mycena sp. CBHHK59/15]|nr:hypothetical protein B0H10DRAFT_2184378 [Mycena sp. CBHHK59/15]